LALTGCVPVEAGSCGKTPLASMREAQSYLQSVLLAIKLKSIRR
jgi:hypothetical protein